jgi:hypothetical protein
MECHCGEPYLRVKSRTDAESLNAAAGIRKSRFPCQTRAFDRLYFSEQLGHKPPLADSNPAEENRF